jgi:hypothetical protein
MSDTPRTDSLLASKTEPITAVKEFMRTIERELNIEKSEKLKYRERAWKAESQLDVRYGLRKEINEALGLTNETRDDALRKGLETIKALKAERQWHKLSNGMPTKDTPVLILAKMYYNGQPIICTATWDGTYWFSHGASGYECELEFDVETITHWMPLPEPPKEAL